MHLFGTLQGDWPGFNIAVSFGHPCIGLTRTVLHDEHGPTSSIVQMLTVPP
ncbi:hypothetical protein [Stenotrophomonas sp. NPDC077659]|uniref:hypothetical protein n=1 Tax=Stenotrophomonas sp. NPDC077659 TaxID=3390694 RepID=UPI003D0757E8